MRQAPMFNRKWYVCGNSMKLFFIKKWRINHIKVVYIDFLRCPN